MPEPKKWRVRYFQSGNGSYPVKEFIESQDARLKIRCAKLIRLLINCGPFLTPPQAKKVDRNLYELRATGKDSVRIFYTKKDEIFYLLHIFKKKLQKIPQREIKTVVDRVREII